MQILHIESHETALIASYNFLSTPNKSKPRKEEQCDFYGTKNILPLYLKIALWRDLLLEI